MNSSTYIHQLLHFLKDAEKLKTTLRHSSTSDSSRQESSAEHSWMLTLLAMVIFDNIKTPVDQLRILKMLIIHDLAEVVTGDIPSFEFSDRQNAKQENERKVLNKLVQNLSEKVGSEIISLWEEMEERQTIEAKIAQAIDKVEVLIQHNIADIKTWDQNDFDIIPYYRDDYFDFEPFFRELKDVVDIQSMRKVEAANLLIKVKTEYRERYNNSSM